MRPSNNFNESIIRFILGSSRKVCKTNKRPHHTLQSIALFKVPHHLLQSTTSPFSKYHINSSKYHTPHFKVPHSTLQSTIPPTSKYHTTLFRVPHHLFRVPYPLFKVAHNLLQSTIQRYHTTLYKEPNTIFKVPHPFPNLIIFTKTGKKQNGGNFLKVPSSSK